MTVFLCPCFRLLTGQPRKMQLSFIYSLIYWEGPRHFTALVMLDVNLNKIEETQQSYFLSDRKDIPNPCFLCPIRHVTEQSYFRFSFYQNPTRFSILLRNPLCLVADSLINELSSTFTHALLSIFYENYILTIWELYFGNVYSLKKRSQWKPS